MKPEETRSEKEEPEAPEAGDAKIADDAPNGLKASPGSGRYSPSFLRGFGTPLAVVDRITIWTVRGFFFLIAAGLGLQGVLAYFPYTSPAWGIIVGGGIGLGLIAIEAIFARSPIRTIAAITFGLLMGLVLAALFQQVLRLIVQAVAPDLSQVDQRARDAFLSYLNLITTSIFCYFGITLLLSTKDEFKFVIPYVEFRKDVKSRMSLILDTSAFVDGRIQPIIATSALDQRLVVPKFVIDELHKLADSADRSLRERGRRGMAILHELEKNHPVDFADRPLEDGEEVDVGLLRLASLHDGKIVTTDHNLTQRARLQGIRVLNINDLATALRPSFVPGDSLRVSLLREGDDPGQAVGFLRDGTMVVVENSRERIGQEVDVVVSNAIQTSTGRMVFGRLQGSKGRPRAS